LNIIALSDNDLDLTFIFHTDRDEEAARPEWAAPNLTVTAVYSRLSRALVLPEEQFKADAVSIRFSQAAAESV